jgi:hypothetical protein
MNKLRKLEDLKTPLLNIWERCDYTNNYLLGNINILIQKGTVIQNFDTATNDMLLNSLKEYENLDILLLMNKSPLESMTYFEEYLKSKYNKIAIKIEKVDKDLFLKIIFQILYERNNIHSYRHFKDVIMRKFEFFKNKPDDEKIDLTIFVLCKKNPSVNQNSIISNEYALYSPDNKKEKWVLSTIFFNKNTLDLLKIQSLEYFFNHEFEEHKRRINIYRNFYFEQFDNIDQSQILLFSSIILYMIGHRKANDIDFMAHNTSEEAKNRLLDFRDKYLNHFRKNDDNDEDMNEFILNDENDNKKNKFIDILIKNTEHWPHYWSIWLDKWARNSGAKYFKEVLANGDYHCYFLGMKMVSLKMDIERRLARQRPRAYADLYALKTRYNLQSINIENFDLILSSKKEGDFYQIKDLSEEEYQEHIKKGAKLRESIGEIYYEIDVDIPRFLKTMKWCLEKRYRIEKSIEDISKELVLPKTSKTSERLKGQMKLTRENEMDITVNSILKMSELRLEEEKINKKSENDFTNKESIQNQIKEAISDRIMDSIIKEETNSNNSLDTTNSNNVVKKRVLKKKN